MLLLSFFVPLSEFNLIDNRKVDTPVVRYQNCGRAHAHE